ncbi:MAG: APC family permease [Bryobacteraceae bacterium]
MSAAPQPELLRSLRRWDLVAVVINGVIGAGIFGLPSHVYALSGVYSLWAFAACAVCVAPIVLCFAEVASRFSGTGGPYLYAREAFGPLTGFAVGWLVWIARVTSLAANASLLPAYLGFFFPSAAAGFPRLAVVTIVVVVLAMVNLRGVRGTADASNALAIGKLLPIAIFIAAGFFFLDPHRFAAPPPLDSHNFWQSVLLLLYAFTGFEMAVIPAGEARNPGKDLAPALMIGMAAVIVVYLSIQAVCIGTLPGLATSQRPLADASGRFLGRGGAALLTAGMLVSLAGNLNALILAASRLLFAMAERQELPRPLANVHPRYRTPAAAILATGFVMLVLIWSGTFIYLVTLSTLARLVTYLSTCAALPVLRRSPTPNQAGFRLPGGAWIACAGMTVCIWLLSHSNLNEARDAGVVLAIGLAIFGLYRISVR